MGLELGHGFIPRIGEENYSAVDRCVGPADLFNPDPLDLPWAIIDGAWAEGRPELLNNLRNHGTKLLVDTHGWPDGIDLTDIVRVLYARRHSTTNGPSIVRVGVCHFSTPSDSSILLSSAAQTKGGRVQVVTATA